MGDKVPTQDGREILPVPCGLGRRVNEFSRTSNNREPSGTMETYSQGKFFRS
jgi:hypothetical protein